MSAVHDAYEKLNAHFGWHLTPRLDELHGNRWFYVSTLMMRSDKVNVFARGELWQQHGVNFVIAKQTEGFTSDIKPEGVELSGVDAVIAYITLTGGSV